MRKKNDKPQLSRSGWVRAMILRKPDITLEQLQKEFDSQVDELGFSKEDRPKAKQEVYQGRNQLRKRWGVSEVPSLSPNGKVNMSALIRAYIDQWPSSSESDAKAYFADDGLELKTGQFTSGKSNYLRNKAKVVGNPTIKSNVIPDAVATDDADEAPRAGKPGKRKYNHRKKPGRKPGKSGEAKGKAAQYESMEDRLETLIVQATELKNRTLVNELKMARRRASAGVILSSS